MAAAAAPRRRHAPALATVTLAACWPANGADLATCRAVTDDRQRLACYDALAAPAPVPAADGAVTAPASPTTIPTGPSPATPTAAGLFGQSDDTAAAELAAAAGVAPLQELTARLAAIDVGADGRLLLTLDNGQAWSQVDTRRSTLEKGMEVRIRRAAFGSYLLSTIDDRRPALRVRRIR